MLGTLLAGGLFPARKLKIFGLLAGVLNSRPSRPCCSASRCTPRLGLAVPRRLVLLIFVHELGHAIVLRREGISAGAPVFIPVPRCVHHHEGPPRDAYVEATVAIGGPVLARSVPGQCSPAGLALQRPFLVTLGHTGILINLFNLIPVSPSTVGESPACSRAASGWPVTRSASWH